MKVEQHICASLFKWNDGFGVADASSVFGVDRSPSSFLMKSPKTEKVLEFKVNLEEAIASDFWDGEFSIFQTEDKKIAVKIWNY
jgi:hypothetical protein